MNIVDKRKRKKRMIIFYVILAIFALGYTAFRIVISNNSHIADTNGDDSSLAAISQEDILSDTFQSTTFASFTNIKDGGRTGVRGTYSGSDVDGIEYSAGKMTGVLLLQATNVTDGKLNVSTQVSLSSGNLRVVLISPSNEIVKEFSKDGTDSFIGEEMENGIYLLKVAGESAKFTIFAKRE